MVQPTAHLGGRPWRPRKRARGPVAAAAGPFNEDLFEQLRDLRKQLASAQGVPPYVIFTDRTLHEMARFFPSTASDMLQLTGLGEKRAAQLGQRFMNAIRQLREAHPEVAPPGSMAVQSEFSQSSPPARVPIL